MTAREHLNDYFNGAAFMTLSAMALAVMTVLAVVMGVSPATVEGSGIFFRFDGALLKPGLMSALAGMLVTLATGGIMLALNKVFSYVRAVTRLYVSAFFLLQLAHPSGLVSLNAGTLMCLVTAVAVMPLFASYQDRHSQRSIFLIFAILATGSMFHYGYLALIPAFLLGFLNMGVLNLKGLLAMLFGLVTPFWIVMGLGIATPADAMAPHIQGIWHLDWSQPGNIVLIVAAVTAALGIMLAALNLSTIMNYRMQTRVYNAFFVFTLVATVIAVCVDCRDAAFYLPLLGLMVAVQIAHAHTLRTTRGHRYVFMILFTVACVATGAIQLLMR